jgi:hypothetical protein
VHADRDLHAVRRGGSGSPNRGRSATTTAAGPASQLLLDGTGDAISGRRTLVLQVLQVDGATRRTLSQTWGGLPLVQPADQVPGLVPALVGARVGSRAVAVLPAADGGHPQVLVVDVVGQL